MTATLPLQSCRIFASGLHWGFGNLGRRGEAVDSNRAGLRTAIEANAASGAIVACVTRRVHSVGTHLRSQLQALRRARLDAQPASFALLDIDGDVALCLTGHSVLLLQRLTW